MLDDIKSTASIFSLQAFKQPGQEYRNIIRDCKNIIRVTVALTLENHRKSLFVAK
jgi:hypothetical protein